MAVTNPYSRQSSSTLTNNNITANSSSSSSSPPPTVPPSLTRQLLTLHHPNQKFTNDAITLSSELLRLFIIEARRRAAIEAECESELSTMMDDDDNDSETEKNNKRRVVEIRADHIAKVAAELLMDLS
ncbi:hypothetical protein ACHAWC_003679 [Mediolabrus comicus]